MTGPKGQLLIRVLLDTCSQRTFIRRDVSRGLGGSSKSVEKLALVAFGKAHHTTARSCHRISVTFTNQHDGKHVCLGALQVPSICGATSPQVTDDARELMDAHGLLAADLCLTSTHMSQHISLLIGSDYYWQITSGQILRLTLHLTAVETLLGWTLQGAHIYRRDHPLAESSALFLAPGEPSPDDVAANQKLSCLRRDVRKEGMQ